MATLQSFGNGVVRWLLRSPLHGVLSGNVLLIALRGRRTGRTIETPVEYAENAGRVLILSRRNRRWWRNIGDQTPVELTLRGRRLAGIAQLVTAPEQVSAHLDQFFVIKPGARRVYGVAAELDGSSRQADLVRLAADRVAVEVLLAGASEVSSAGEEAQHV